MLPVERSIVIPGEPVIRPKIHFTNQRVGDLPTIEIVSHGELNLDFDRLNPQVRRANLVLTGLIPTLGDRRAQLLWRGSIARLNEASGLKYVVQEELNAKRQAAQKSGGDGVTWQDINYTIALQAGATYTELQILREQLATIERARIPRGLSINGDPLKYAAKSITLEAQRVFYRLYGFIECASLSVRIGQVALVDFFEAGRSDSFDLGQSFRFLVEAYRLRYNQTHHQIVALNSSPLSETYPAIALAVVEQTSEFAIAMAETPSSGIIELLKRSKGIRKEALGHALRASKMIEKIYDRIHRVIFDPKSNEFLPVSEVVEAYLSAGENERIISLLVLGLRNNNQINSFNEDAVQLSKGDIRPEFYRLLASSVRDWVENETEDLPEIYVLGKLVPFLDADRSIEAAEESGMKTPSLEALQSDVAAIIPRLTKTEYEFGSNVTNFLKPTAPTKIRIKFYPDRKNNFRITLEYQTDDNRLKELWIEYHLDLKVLSWSLIDNINWEGFKLYRDLALMIGKSVLGYINAQLEAEEKPASRNGVSNEVAALPIPVHEAPGKLTSNKRKGNGDRRFPSSPSKEASERKATGGERNEVRIRISFLKTGKDALKGLSVSAKKRAEKSIHRVNKSCHGDIIILTGCEYDGKPVYRLRIGDLRVLLSPDVSNSNHLFTLRVFDIGPRDSIYKKWGFA